ncbi:MAG: hypothetical protein FWE76_04850 [Symbiobacteriaceae bacterium]|nr:hypothetical protein [Symbiobacteriaceae bacterium]
MSRFLRTLAVLLICFPLYLLPHPCEAAPPGGQDPVFTISRIVASQIDKGRATATAEITVTVTDLGYQNRIGYDQITSYASQSIHIYLDYGMLTTPEVIISQASSRRYASLEIGSTGQYTLFIPQVEYPSGINEFVVNVIMSSSYGEFTYLTAVENSQRFTFDPEKGTVYADPLPGGKVDILAELFCFDPLAEDTSLYYRLTLPGKTPGKWTNCDLPLRAGSFSIAKLVNKGVKIEFLSSKTAPGNEMAASSSYRFTDRSSISIKPRVAGYVTLDETFYARIFPFAAEALTFKRTSDVAFFSTLAEGCLTVGAFCLGEENEHGLPEGLYYPVGITATQLEIAAKPVDRGSLGEYTAASKAVRLTVAQRSKAPNPKPNYSRNVIPMKDGAFEIYVEGSWRSISSTVYNEVYSWNGELKGLPLTAKLYEAFGPSEHHPGGIPLRLAAGKKPGSDMVTVPLLPMAQIGFDISEYVSITGGKLVPVSGSYPLEHRDNESGKWKKNLPKYTAGQPLRVEFRIAAGATYAPSESAWLEIDREGNLGLTYFPGTYLEYSVAFLKGSAYANGTLARVVSVQMTPANTVFEVIVNGIPEENARQEISIFSPTDRYLPVTASSNVRVEAKAGQELKNHRITFSINIRLYGNVKDLIISNTQLPP